MTIEHVSLKKTNAETAVRGERNAKTTLWDRLLILGAGRVLVATMGWVVAGSLGCGTTVASDPDAGSTTGDDGGYSYGCTADCAGGNPCNCFLKCIHTTESTLDVECDQGVCTCTNSSHVVLGMCPLDDGGLADVCNWACCIDFIVEK